MSNVSNNASLPLFFDSDLNTKNLQVDKGFNIFRDEIPLAMPIWEVWVTVISLTLIIICTIVGNVLVILSVFTYRPLRIVQNFFLVSLAVADLTVAVFVLPFNVAYNVIGKWIFGIHVCEMWLTCDILCCTASILSLCAIALDRYWAITDPINYAQKRTLKRVVIMIAMVWAVSVIICLPPLFGWNDWPEEFNINTPCILTKARGFVIYSSMGSFYVPLVIMTIVYIKIFFATRRRLRERAKASKINQIKSEKTKIRVDEDSVISDSGQNGFGELQKKNYAKGKKKKKKRKASESDKENKSDELTPPHNIEDSITENDLSIRDSSRGRPVKTADVVVEIAAGTTNQIHQFIREKQKISLSKERRAARTLGIIMGVFVVCWLPFFLVYVILPFCSLCSEPNEKIMNFITWLGYINSSLNPVIYTIFNLDFRKAFAKYLRCSSSKTNI